MTDNLHYPHCLAMNSLDAVCNRDAGHPGPHESRSGRGAGCIGWAPQPDEDRYLEPSHEVKMVRVAALVESMQKRVRPS